MANFPSSDNDTIFGSNGSDVIDAQGGNDTVYGGGGVVAPNDAADTLFGSGGDDLVYGNGGNDLIRGGSQFGFNVYDSFTGKDALYGGFGRDSIYGDDNADTVAGGGGAVYPVDDGDFLSGGLGDDIIYGNGGDDTIVGGRDAGENASSDDDIIYGGLGNDLIYGSGGLDAIAGQDGNDTLAGGTDADLFFIGSNGGQDVILDFQDPDSALDADYIADDQLIIEKNINGTGIDTFAELMAVSQVAHGNLVFNFGSGNALTLQGITTLDANDVRFSDSNDTLAVNDTVYGATQGNNTFLGYELRSPLFDGDNNTNNVITDRDFGQMFVIKGQTGTVNLSIIDFAGTTNGAPDRLFIQANIDGTGIDTYAELQAVTTYDPLLGGSPGRPPVGGLHIELSNSSEINLYGITQLPEANVVFFQPGDYLS